MRKITVYEHDIDDGPTVTLEFEADTNTIVTRKVCDAWIVGYLVHDAEGYNIDDLMGDCMGKLYSFHRHAPKSEHRSALDALGLDSYGNPADDQFENQAVDELLKTEDYFGMEADDISLDDLKARCPLLWEEAIKAGTIGDKYAVVLDCYDHSGQHWSISGGGMQCRFDTAKGAGVWVPDDCLRKQLDDDMAEGKDRVTQAELYCKQFLDQYNAIIAGDVWGVVVQMFDEDGNEIGDNDAVWGHVGSDWAEQALDEEMKATEEYYAKQHAKEVHNQGGKQEEMEI